MHYRHQGDAVRSPSAPVTNAFLDERRVILVLDDGRELRWRAPRPRPAAPDAGAVPGKRVAYPDQHALRVGSLLVQLRAGRRLAGRAAAQDRDRVVTPPAPVRVVARKWPDRPHWEYDGAAARRGRARRLGRRRRSAR